MHDRKDYKVSILGQNPERAVIMGCVEDRQESAIEAESCIRRRAARGSRQQLADLLAKAPDAPPLPDDELP